MVSYILMVFFSTIFLGVPLVQAFLKANRSMDLLFLVLCNSVFLIATTAFLFYFHEMVLSALASFFLFGYSIFLFLELKKENKEISLFSIPYFLFTVFLFSFLFFSLWF